MIFLTVKPAVFLAFAILGVLLIAGIWDIWMWAEQRYTDTVSAILWDWAISFPSLVLAIGFLLGHLFWPQHPQR